MSFFLLVNKGKVCFHNGRTVQEILHVDSPGGGGKLQEIDGEDGENPSLCRNRVVPGAE